MSKPDIRVAKTKRAIREAFLSIICDKPVNRITVASLAQTAEINKGTFYLHYQDIYALYDELLVETVEGIAAKCGPYAPFFAAPEAFVRAFLYGQASPPARVDVAMLREDNLRFSRRYPTAFIDAFRAQLYAVGRLSKSRENDARLEYVLNGMLSLLIRPGLLGDGGPDGDAYVVGFVAGSIRQLFHEFFDS